MIPYVLITLAWLGVVVLALCLFAGGAESTCDHNCNQGRGCTCAKSNHA